MKKLLLTTVLGFLFTATIFSQSDRMIQYEKTFGGYRFTQNGYVLNLNSMKSITSTVPDALKHVKKAKLNYTVSYIFNYAGGFMIGWPLGTAIAGGDPEWGLMLIGAGLIGVGIPFTMATNKNAKLAADLYNNHYRNNDTGAVLRFGVNPNGVGLSLTF